jgi:hypothetical protein
VRFYMGKKSGATPRKRLKEVRLFEKRKAKEAKRVEAKERRDKARTDYGDEDPDIAGIRPGPQPLPEQWDDLDNDE